ncbi:MAG: gliding motility-associated protein GldE [Paludibacter sp.]|nr:gliding motility-associated protein GldE [Paludibacter sp.]
MLLSLIIDNITFNPFSFNDLISLIIAFTLLVLSGLISASEVAFFSFTPTHLAEMEQGTDKSEKKILQLLQNPQKLLAAILIGNNFVNVAIILILTYVTNNLINFGGAPLLGFIFQTVIITFLLLLMGEILPKVYASKEARKVATFTYPLLNALLRIFKPFVKILVNSTSALNTRLAKHHKSNISIDELSHALELTSGNNDEDTDILEGIIKFGNIQVIDIMTPRVDIDDIDIKTSYKKLLDKIIHSGYSRIPVYSGSHDNIKGILYSKDLLPHLDKPDTFRWQTLIRQAYYVPETKMIDDLLSEFQKNKVHLAIVVDEYGGTSGLVTLEDIIEEIIGDISDEYDEDEQLFTKLDNHTFIFEAKILLNDFFKIDEIDEEDFTKVTAEVETLAGLILELKGEIPNKNERIGFDKYVFEILSVDNRRIKKVKLYIKDHVED